MLKYFNEFSFFYITCYFNTCIIFVKKTPTNIELHKNVFQTLYSDKFAFAFVFVDLFSIYYLYSTIPAWLLHFTDFASDITILVGSRCQ